MMRLGTETGSLVNHFMSRTASPEPVVGMGVTILSWTDRSPATVIQYDGLPKNMIAVQSDNYTRIDQNGMSDSQEYEYTADPEGYIYFYKKDGRGKWRRATKNENGRFVFSDTGSIVFGHRERYYDFSF